MNNRSDLLIQQLAGDLQPVRPLRREYGRILVFTALAATVALAAVLFRGAADPAASLSAPYFVMTNGLLLLLGLASSFSVVSMALPRVGAEHEAPKWAMATVALLPLAAIGVALAGDIGAGASLVRSHDLACFGFGSLFATITAATLFYWLRRGAPVSPEKAGLFLGVAAGAMGSFAYGLFCPVLSIAHLGIWHVLPVALWAVAGRLAVPSLVRW